MKQSHKPTKQNHWHTIEFSHNTRTPKHTPFSPGPVQSGLPDPTHTHTTYKIACHANQVKGSTSARFPTAISPEPSPNRTARRGVVGHADSHKATHTQPTTQIRRLLGLNGASISAYLRDSRDGRSKLVQLLDKVRITSVDVLDVVHDGLPVRDQARQHKAGTRADIGRPDIRRR